MANIFDNVPVRKTGVHRNHLTPCNELSFNWGGLYPIFCKTVLPNDCWSMSLQSFVRSVPLLSPVMHRNDIKVDAFFVPFRLIWDSAEIWHAIQDETVRRPKMKVKSSLTSAQKSAIYSMFFDESSVNDYLGFASIPLASFPAGKDASDREVCALPWRAYRFIYDYYYRNKAVEDEVTANIPGFYGDNDNELDLNSAQYLLNHTQNNPANKVLLRPWRRDLFTSALPDPQNGGDILIPQADIVADDQLKVINNVDANAKDLQQLTSGNLSVAGANPSSNSTLKYGGGLKLDPSGATIRKLRQASYLEEFEEAQARGGSNRGFKEFLRNIWNVKSSDARLDRPEYLGGYRGPIQISEIPQTSASTATSAQGTLAGKGLSVGGQRLFKKMFFEEPGILMVIMSVTPKSAYCQGDPREWLYDSPFDFPNPYFDNLGEQEVKMAELNAMAELDSSAPTTLGYNVRNYEMKSYPDEIHGALRSSLSYWHEGRLFAWNNYPGLNYDFLKVAPSDVSRIFPSSETSDKLIGQFFFDIRLKRHLNWYGLPKFG